jgi:hypothetical protein
MSVSFRIFQFIVFELDSVNSPTRKRAKKAKENEAANNASSYLDLHIKGRQFLTLVRTGSVIGALMSLGVPP